MTFNRHAGEAGIALGTRFAGPAATPAFAGVTG